MSERPRATGWINVGFSPWFALKRGGLLSFQLVPFGICIADGHGWLAVPALFLILWPHRYTFVVEEQGLRVAWSFLKHWLAWDDLERLEVIRDPRRFVIGRRPWVLRIHRRRARPLTITSDRSSLEHLAAAITQQLSLHAEPRRSSTS